LYMKKRLKTASRTIATTSPAEVDLDYGKPAAAVCDALSEKRRPLSSEDRTFLDSLDIA
jgi:hypothetical protein